MQTAQKGMWLGYSEMGRKWNFISYEMQFRLYWLQSYKAGCNASFVLLMNDTRHRHVSEW